MTYSTNQSITIKLLFNLNIQPILSNLTTAIHGSTSKTQSLNPSHHLNHPNLLILFYSPSHSITATPFFVQRLTKLS